MTEDWRALNRANWDERVPIHRATALYDRTHRRAGRGRLDAIAEAGLGDVTGLRVAHLQRHMGDGTLSIAQRGAAEVVGLDFSAPAIAEARVTAALLRPGGRPCFAESHPVALVLDDVSGATEAEGRPGWFAPYFHTDALAIEDAHDHVNANARLVSSRTHQWMTSLGAILAALREPGPRLDALEEHAGLAWRMFNALAQGPDRLRTWPGPALLPLGLSLHATRD